MAIRKISKTFCLAAFASLMVSTAADAQRAVGSGGAAARAGGAAAAQQARASASGSVNRAQTANRGRNTNQNINRNQNVNQNINRNTNTNINNNNNNNINIDRDVNIDIDNGWHRDWDDYHYHPIATAAVVTAAVATTAWVVGSYYRTLPPNCATIYRGTVVYYQCGTYWYQPVYSGSSVQYVAIVAP